jgi:hypothetical protein
MTMSCITAVLQESFNDAFPSKKVRPYLLIFTKEYMGVMLHQGAFSEKLSDKVFTGQWPSPHGSDREVL